MPQMPNHDENPSVNFVDSNRNSSTTGVHMASKFCKNIHSEDLKVMVLADCLFLELDNVTKTARSPCKNVLRVREL